MVTVREFNKLPGGLSEDKSAWEFPAVCSVNAHGKNAEWRIRVFAESATDGTPVKIRKEYLANVIGVPGDDVRVGHKVDSGVVGGKIRETSPTYVSAGKNIGRSNETNKFCQAMRDAYGMFLNQQKRAGVAPATATSDDIEHYPPMLAGLLADVKEIDFSKPVFVQRKYNGLRCMTTLHKGEVIFYGRGKTHFSGFTELAEQLKVVFARAGTRAVYIDGEIYSHGMSLQEVSGITRKMRDDSGDKSRLGYQVYDCFVPSKPAMLYSERRALLDEIFEGSPIRPVETFAVTSRAEIAAYFEQFLREGYEGLMVRLNAAYRLSHNGYHSSVLLKLKKTFDHEYRVVGWSTSTKGKTAGALMLECETETGTRFMITPAATIETRVALAAQMPQTFETEWLGKMIVVYFDERSNDGVPLRARTNMETATEK